MDQFEQPASPMKNFVSGGGCGCGCIGMLVVLVAGVGLAAVPVGFFPEAYGSVMGMLSVAGVITGVLLAILGGSMWTASLFLD